MILISHWDLCCDFQVLFWPSVVVYSEDSWLLLLVWRFPWCLFCSSRTRCLQWLLTCSARRDLDLSRRTRNKVKPLKQTRLWSMLIVHNLYFSLLLTRDVFEHSGKLSRSKSCAEGYAFLPACIKESDYCLAKKVMRRGGEQPGRSHWLLGDEEVKLNGSLWGIQFSWDHLYSCHNQQIIPPADLHPSHSFMHFHVT